MFFFSDQKRLLVRPVISDLSHVGNPASNWPAMAAKVVVVVHVPPALNQPRKEQEDRTLELLAPRHTRSYIPRHGVDQRVQSIIMILRV